MKTMKKSWIFDFFLGWGMVVIGQQHVLSPFKKQNRQKTATKTRDPFFSIQHASDNSLSGQYFLISLPSVLNKVLETPSALKNTILIYKLLLYVALEFFALHLIGS